MDRIELIISFVESDLCNYCSGYMVRSGENDTTMIERKRSGARLREFIV